MNQELGGVMVTLAALSNAIGLRMDKAGQTEVERIWQKIEKIRAKQAAKPKHSPLPQSVPPPASEGKESLTEKANKILSTQIKDAMAAAEDLYGYWQCCPCCGGLGYMQEGRVEGTNIVNNCPVCEGSKIIQRPKVETPAGNQDELWDEIRMFVIGEGKDYELVSTITIDKLKSLYLLIKK